jgi:molybdenum cofactor cytidylyltransferase
VRRAASALAGMLSDEGLEIVECRDAAEGMGRTLAAGVRARPGVGGWVVALADMPYIRPQSIAAVAKALSDGAPIAAAACRGERGHPVGLAAHYYHELSRLQGDQGARDILRRDGHSLVLAETDDPGVMRDIDTPADL